MGFQAAVRQTISHFIPPPETAELSKAEPQKVALKSPPSEPNDTSEVQLKPSNTTQQFVEKQNASVPKPVANPELDAQVRNQQQLVQQTNTRRGTSSETAVADRMKRLGFTQGTQAPTKAEIKKFQTSAGIGVDGIVGPQTRGTLQKADQVMTQVKDPNLKVPGLVGVAVGNRTLEPGDQNKEAIAAMQNSLKARGYGDIPTNGVFDEAKTGAYLKDWQTRNGVGEKGVFGQKTFTAMARQPPPVQSEPVAPNEDTAVFDPSKVENGGICPVDKRSAGGPQRFFQDKLTAQYQNGDFNGVKRSLRTMAVGGRLSGKPVASRLLNNFLDSKGDVEIDTSNSRRPRAKKTDWISDAPSTQKVTNLMDQRAEAEIRRRVANGETSGVVRLHDHVATNSKEDGDLYHALGKFSLKGEYRFEVNEGAGAPETTIQRKFTADDRYDWDPPRQCGIVDHVIPYMLEQEGKAQSFDVKVKWRDADIKLSEG